MKITTTIINPIRENRGNLRNPLSSSSEDEGGDGGELGGVEELGGGIAVTVTTTVSETTLPNASYGD